MMLAHGPPVNEQTEHPSLQKPQSLTLLLPIWPSIQEAMTLCGTSLVVPGLRIRLLMQRTRV